MYRSIHFLIMSLLVSNLHAGLACPFARHATSRSLALLGLEGPWLNIGRRVWSVYPKIQPGSLNDKIIAVGLGVGCEEFTNFIGWECLEH